MTTACATCLDAAFLSRLVRTGEACRDRAFTLVEILAVISIIAVLAGIAIAVYGRAVSAANENRTKALMARIVMGLESYKGDYDEYPLSCIPGAMYSKYQLSSSDQSGSVTEAGGAEDAATGVGLKKALVDDADYLDYPEEHIYVGSHEGVVVEYLADAWEKPLVYISGIDREEVDAPEARLGVDNGYELWSAGPDMKFEVSTSQYDTLRPAGPTPDSLDEDDDDADNIEAKRTAR